MKIEDVCAEYLNNINPLARRVAEDIGSLRLNNDATHDKETLASIDQQLIQSQLVEKYKSEAEECPQLVPESNFSWFSKSQLNLFTAINVKPVHKTTPSRPTQVLSPLRKGAKDEKDSIQTKTKAEDKPVKHPAKKPKTPPPPPPAKLVPVSQPKVVSAGAAVIQQGLSQSDDEDIPKTGFDFLDNW